MKYLIAYRRLIFSFRQLYVTSYLPAGMFTRAGLIIITPRTMEFISAYDFRIS